MLKGSYMKAGFFSSFAILNGHISHAICVCKVETKLGDGTNYDSSIPNELHYKYKLALYPFYIN